MSPAIKLAYYCSGHGYGHATRVSAFASSLLSLDVAPIIYIVSSAPLTVFSECVNRGAHYRHVDVDPIIVQPLAYQVDRQESLHVLQKFLSQKQERLAAEVQWLLSEQIDCILSDAAFLACEAANSACIPSILITNFTFDSVYSYLSAETNDPLPSVNLQISTSEADLQELVQDRPIPEGVLVPLVSQLLLGYRHADVLLLLPGFIPIPSFFENIPLPATAWIDSSTKRFKPSLESLLQALPTSDPVLLPSIPFPSRILDPAAVGELSKLRCTPSRKPQRIVKYAPLLVRPVSADIHTFERRSKLLSSIGVPEKLHDPAQTQILVVSFGGHKIRRPHIRNFSSRGRPPTPPLAKYLADQVDQVDHSLLGAHSQETSDISFQGGSLTSNSFKAHSRKPSSKIFIPGAPAPFNSPTAPEQPNLEVISPSGPSSHEPSLLPSSSWIAIICGVPYNWSVSGDEEALPTGFYVAPSDVYMPDLTAVADVLLGKLGYGTVSESVAQGTPLVYVSRPLFVEEYGLRLFLETEGTGVELSREEYESGAWANKVEEAYLKSKKKARIYQDSDNAQRMKELAMWVVESVKDWRG